MIDFNGAFLRPKIWRPLSIAMDEAIKHIKDKEMEEKGEKKLEKRKETGETFTAKFVDDNSHATVVKLDEDLEEDQSLCHPAS